MNEAPTEERPTGKRYYWLKLQDGFFNSKRIKKLRRLAGGDTYTIIYLKMQLLSLKTDGVLRWTGLEDDIASELALDLDETPDNVEVTLRFLLAHGLAETSDNINFLLPYAVENTGSETSAAKRMRDMRARNNITQGRNDVTHECNKVTQASQCYATVTPALRDRYGEKEKDTEKDKDRETEKEKDISSIVHQSVEGGLRGEQTLSPAPVDNPVENSPPADEERAGRLDFFVKQIRSFNARGYNTTNLYDWAAKEGFSAAEIDGRMKEAEQS